ITCENRHRALDDAKVLYHFYEKLKQTIPLEQLDSAIEKCFKKPSLPVKLDASFLDTLPESPGIYIFYDGQNMTLYVGKSKKIRIKLKIKYKLKHLIRPSGKRGTSASRISLMILESLRSPE